VSGNTATARVSCRDHRDGRGCRHKRRDLPIPAVQAPALPPQGGPEHRADG